MITQKDLDAVGITRLQVATATGIPYGSLSGKLNGYTLLRPDEEKKIRAVIADFSHLDDSKEGERRALSISENLKRAEEVGKQ